MSTQLYGFGAETASKNLRVKSMRLTSINKEHLSDTDIQEIVYNNITDDLKCTTYGLVFGNSLLIKERVATAVLAYRTGRIKKVIFTGGVGGVSNQNNETISEALRMKLLAVKTGIKEEDILIEEDSNNTFENVSNSLKLLPKNLHELAIITSEFHLKRCLGIFKKDYPQIAITTISSHDGFSDSTNWFLSDLSWNSGRSLATYEAKLLIKYAKEGKIFDFDIPNLNIEYYQKQKNRDE